MSGRCIAINKKGERCRNDSEPFLNRCSVHQSIFQETGEDKYGTWSEGEASSLGLIEDVEASPSFDIESFLALPVEIQAIMAQSLTRGELLNFCKADPERLGWLCGEDFMVERTEVVKKQNKTPVKMYVYEKSVTGITNAISYKEDDTYISFATKKNKNFAESTWVPGVDGFESINFEVLTGTVRATGLNQYVRVNNDRELHRLSEKADPYVNILTYRIQLPKLPFAANGDNSKIDMLNAIGSESSKCQIIIDKNPMIIGLPNVYHHLYNPANSRMVATIDDIPSIKLISELESLAVDYALERAVEINMKWQDFYSQKRNEGIPLISRWRGDIYGKFMKSMLKDGKQTIYEERPSTVY